jgi:hypothetical protein
LEEHVSSTFLVKQWAKQETSMEQVASRAVDFQCTTWCYFLEDGILHNQWYNNLKSYDFLPIVILWLYNTLIFIFSSIYIWHLKFSCYRKWSTISSQMCCCVVLQKSADILEELTASIFSVTSQQQPLQLLYGLLDKPEEGSIFIC